MFWHLIKRKKSFLNCITKWSGFKSCVNFSIKYCRLLQSVFKKAFVKDIISSKELSYVRSDELNGIKEVMGQQKPKISKMKEYKDWIKSISSRYRQCVIKAAVSVNQELISFYWNLGKEIAEHEAERKYGSDFYTSLSKDLKKSLPGDKGFASTNLRYMVKFYLLYSGTNLPQVVGDFRETDLFSIPWGHHRLIIDRCKGNKNKAVFFILKKRRLTASAVINSGQTASEGR